MDKLFENAKKELHQIEQNGLSSSNLDTAWKLASLAKNVKKIEEKEGESRMRDRYMDHGYEPRDRYPSYRDDEEYGRRMPYMPARGRYRGPEGERLGRHLEHIEDGVDMYTYGRERYYDSGDKHRMHEGLEKFMYGICMFVETAMDFAETPEEKEIIRKHIQKIKAM
jgi:hypothetical protein